MPTQKKEIHIRRILIITYFFDIRQQLADILNSFILLILREYSFELMVNL